MKKCKKNIHEPEPAKLSDQKSLHPQIPERCYRRTIPKDWCIEIAFFHFLNFQTFLKNFDQLSLSSTLANCRSNIVSGWGKWLRRLVSSDSFQSFRFRLMTDRRMMKKLKKAGKNWWNTLYRHFFKEMLKVDLIVLKSLFFS